jgi:hypothetical protein
MIRIFRVAIFTLVMLTAALGPAIAPSAAGAAANGGSVTVTGSTAVMDFPLSLNFAARISSSSNITDVRLRYKVAEMSFASVTSEAFMKIAPSTSVKAAYTLDMRKVGGLPPGTSLDYWWLVKDAGGAVMESQQQTYQVQDNRYHWQNLSAGKISLFWYEGDTDFSRALMATAQQALVDLARNTGASPDKVIAIYIYNGARDLQGSMIYPNEWTGGVAFTSYNVVAIGITPGNLTWGQGAMVHELTHIVTNQVTFNPYSGLPVWLNEGLSMYAEGPLTSQFTDPLTKAQSTGTLISVRSLCSPFSADSAKANLSYAESFSLVDFLVKAYGPSKMQALLGTFQQGSTYDGAFQAVYGFDIDGLEKAWEASFKQ